MVLEPVVCRLIDSGKKTMLRRPMVGGEPRYRPRAKGVRDGGQSLQLVRPPVPKVGDRWPIKPGPEKPVMCRVRVVLVRTEQHGVISYEDVRREGYRTTVEYKAAWVRWQDRQWLAQVGDELDPTINEHLIPRFDARWADREVSVVQFEVDRTAARYLAASPGALLNDKPDYVSSSARAMKGEGAAVDEATQRAITVSAAGSHLVSQMEVWRESRDRIASEIARLRSTEMGRDFGSAMRALERQLERLDRKINPAA